LDPIAYGRYAGELSEPAAGAFTAFVLDALGETGYREFYSRAVGATSVRPILEEAFDDSLGGIARRWSSFLEAAALEPGGEPVIEP
jgi:hypothetical protein